MSSAFANRRKPRKIGGDENDDGGGQDSEPVVKRPVSSKTKQKSKMRVSFGPGETSMMADDREGDSEVVIPKRHGLGRRAVERSAAQRSATPSKPSEQPPVRTGLGQDRPSYSDDYLKELRESTPSTPKTSTDEEKDKTVDVAAKFGEVMKVSAPSTIPGEVEIREKKARRARLANEQDYIPLDEAGEDEELALKSGEDAPRDTRLLRDDEDFAEGFDDFVEDGRISLGRKAEREQKRKHREEMRELIDGAEGLSDDEDSDLDERAAYEATQTKAAMGNGGQEDRPRTPPKLTPLPRLGNSLERLRTILAVTEQSKEQMIARMDELRKEKADIAAREVEIQGLIREAGENYENLKQEAGVTPGSEDSASAVERGPIVENEGDPHLCRHSDATPVELFFDLFFVANLSSFTATHEINNVEALGAYVGFLGVIWFTWLQVTLFDVRFARDSIFERGCKAVQLGFMVGFASAGTRFTTRVRDENAWAFQSLSLFLAGSRILLAIQYGVNILLVRKRMRSAAKGMSGIAATLLISSSVYLWMYFAFLKPHELRPYIWTVWFALFGLEMWIVMGLSCVTPGIGFQDTHLNGRMGLLTLIIIGEGAMAVTRIVNKTVRPGGWTKWSFVHILGVTTNVYFIWQAYYALSPRSALGRFAHQLWAQLHFPFHIALILLLEGSQILALTLDITLKLTYLAETIMFACEEPRPRPGYAISLLNSTIADMVIDYSKGVINEQIAISDILGELSNGPLCPADDNPSATYGLTRERMNDLMGNVTAALFSSMGMTPSEDEDISELDSTQLLRMYMEVLGLVYVYHFAAAALTMTLFAAFAVIARRHRSRVHNLVGIAARIVLAALLAGLCFFASSFALAFSFMTSPAILYAFTLVLLAVLLVDRFLDHLAARNDPPATAREGDARDLKLLPGSEVVVITPQSVRVTIAERRASSF
ncbi:hypothetical protein PHISP_03472 [Aspergillus sp. HF37]|nr:hypothetical protein PHISP_03472 [Aspergillus sp. HF37]